jgi:hypothetical protein
VFDPRAPVVAITASRVLTVHFGGTDANVDVLDVTGQHQFNVQGTILKQRLDLEGKVIDEEYGIS